DVLRRSDRFLAGHVEEVQPIRIDGQTHTVVDLEPHRRLHARHQAVRTRLDVQQDLRAQRLDDVDDGVEDVPGLVATGGDVQVFGADTERSEEHTSELQSRFDLVCRLLLEKKKKIRRSQNNTKTISQ